MKRFKGCLLLAVLGIVFCICSVAFAGGTGETGDSAIGAEYGQTLFDTGFVHTISILLSDEDWGDLMENPADKTKYRADIEIDGEIIKDVSFATKGNSSLFIVAADPDSSRYSYRVNFGKFIKGQTYRGLDKLSLNNNISDATLMKDYFSYEIFRQVGVPAPLTSYVWLTVNGL